MSAPRKGEGFQFRIAGGQLESIIHRVVREELAQILVREPDTFYIAPDSPLYKDMQEIRLSGIRRDRPAYLAFGVSRIGNPTYIWRCITAIPNEPEILHRRAQGAVNLHTHAEVWGE